MEELLNSIREYNILKILINEENKNNNRILKNVIIETKSGELFASCMQIQETKDFNSKQEEHGVYRNHISEKEHLKYNPKNIERITFLIDNKEYEFVRCSRD